MSKEMKKCAHEICKCMTSETYCSEVCRDARNVTELACQCSHPECRA